MQDKYYIRHDKTTKTRNSKDKTATKTAIKTAAKTRQTRQSKKGRRR